MTAIEQAIRQAVEKGGFMDHLFSSHKRPITVEQSKRRRHDLLIFGSGFWNMPYTFNRHHLLSIPSFWQALGTARRWAPHGSDLAYKDYGWRKNWHRFIDALAEGKTAEEFFAELKN